MYLFVINGEFENRPRDLPVSYRSHIFGYGGNHFVFGYACVSKNVQNNVKNEKNDKGPANKDLGVYTVSVPSEGQRILMGERSAMVEARAKLGWQERWEDTMDCRKLEPWDP